MRDVTAKGFLVNGTPYAVTNARATDILPEIAPVLYTSKGRLEADRISKVDRPIITFQVRNVVEIVRVSLETDCRYSLL